MDKRDPHDDATLANRLQSLGLPDDLPETVLADESTPTHEALQRIKQKTLARIKCSATAFQGGRKSHRLSRLIVATAVLLAAGFMAGALISTAQIWSGMQKLLTLMPDAGPVEQSGDAPVTMETIRVEYNGGYIEVSGLPAQSDTAFLSIIINEIPGLAGYDDQEPDEYAGTFKLLRQIYLVDLEGQQYWFADGNNAWQAAGACETKLNLALPPLDRETRMVTLVVQVGVGGGNKDPRPYFKQNPEVQGEPLQPATNFL